MKQRMNEFEESLNCINIINSIANLKRKIGQLEYKLKYSITCNGILSNGRINNRNEDSKEELKMQNRLNLKARCTMRSTQIKTVNAIEYKNVENSINRSDQNL